MRFLVRLPAILMGLFLAAHAYAQGQPCDCNPGQQANCICVSGDFPGTQVAPLILLGRMAIFAAVSAAIICTGIFIVGAFFLTASRGKDDMVQKGKDLMTGALIGLAVVLGSYAILRTALYVIYA